jgi:hypothetical protein
MTIAFIGKYPMRVPDAVASRTSLGVCKEFGRYAMLLNVCRAGCVPGSFHAGQAPPTARAVVVAAPLTRLIDQSNSTTGNSTAISKPHGGHSRFVSEQVRCS